MARDLDAMAAIFLFEPKCYADTALPVEFVGHPSWRPTTCRRCVTIRPGRCCCCREAGNRRSAGFSRCCSRAFARSASAREWCFPSDDILDALRAAVPPANVTLLPVVERRGGGAGGSAAQRGRLGRARGGLQRRRRAGWSASPKPGRRRPAGSGQRRSVAASAAHVERHDVDALRAGGHSGAIAYRANPLTTCSENAGAGGIPRHCESSPA